MLKLPYSNKKMLINLFLQPVSNLSVYKTAL